MKNPTVLVILLNISIVILCGFVTYITREPLAILGLFMLQQVPIIQEPEYEEEEIPAEYEGNPEGFGFSKD